MNIYQRINAVRADVANVAKDSTVRTGGESYAAVSHDAVTMAVRAAMIEHGVLCMPSLKESSIADAGATKRGTPIIRFQGIYAVEFVNVHDPADKVSIDVAAHANDMGDKAPGKALSYATKSAMLKVFTLPTGDDDESRVDPQSSAGSADRLLQHNAAVRDCIPIIAAVKEHIAAQDMDRAAEAWSELSRKEERALWMAPSKGGVWTTEEAAAVKSAEFTAPLKTRREDAGWYDNPDNQL